MKLGLVPRNPRIFTLVQLASDARQGNEDHNQGKICGGVSGYKLEQSLILEFWMTSADRLVGNRIGS